MAHADTLRWATPWRNTGRTSSSHSVNGEFCSSWQFWMDSSNIKHCWFTLLCFCCLGEKKTLLHGQVAWVIAGGQLTTSPTTGTGAAHFINSRFLVKYLLELAGLIISYVVTSAWHPALTRTTDGPPTPDLVDEIGRASWRERVSSYV